MDFKYGKPALQKITHDDGNVDSLRTFLVTQFSQFILFEEHAAWSTVSDVFIFYPLKTKQDSIRFPWTQFVTQTISALLVAISLRCTVFLPKSVQRWDFTCSSYQTTYYTSTLRHKYVGIIEVEIVIQLNVLGKQNDLKSAFWSWPRLLLKSQYNCPFELNSGIFCIFSAGCG